MKLESLVGISLGINSVNGKMKPKFGKKAIVSIIFFAILGGIKVFGMNGLILGPLTVILFFTVLNLLLNKKELPLEAD